MRITISSTIVISSKDLRRLYAAYITSPLTIKELLRAFDLSETEFNQLRRKYNWPNRPRSRVHLIDGDSDRIYDQRQLQGAARKDLNFQLLQHRASVVLDRQITDIETQMITAASAPKPVSAADRERNARTLSILLRTLEKLTELQRTIADTEIQKETEDRSEIIDQIRRNLERRLSRLGKHKTD